MDVAESDSKAGRDFRGLPCWERGIFAGKPTREREGKLGSVLVAIMNTCCYRLRNLPHSLSTPPF